MDVFWGETLCTPLYPVRSMFSPLYHQRESHMTPSQVAWH